MFPENLAAIITELQRRLSEKAPLSVMTTVILTRRPVTWALQAVDTSDEQRYMVADDEELVGIVGTCYQLRDFASEILRLLPECPMCRTLNIRDHCCVTPDLTETPGMSETEHVVDAAQYAQYLAWQARVKSDG